tara:strand:- start:273 stop:524 length:252 start_codon:yes stop_codon:yes gene_type:complete
MYALYLYHVEMIERNQLVGKIGESYRDTRRAIKWLGLETYGRYFMVDSIGAITFLEIPQENRMKSPLLVGRRSLTCREKDVMA